MEPLWEVFANEAKEDGVRVGKVGPYAAIWTGPGMGPWLQPWCQRHTNSPWAQYRGELAPIQGATWCPLFLAWHPHGNLHV